MQQTRLRAIVGASETTGANDQKTAIAIVHVRDQTEERRAFVGSDVCVCPEGTRTQPRVSTLGNRFHGAIRPERAIDDTREPACERQERSVLIVSWFLVADVHDGDCGFWSSASSGFGGLFRSDKSSGPDRTVAAAAPVSWLHATTRSVRLNGRIA